VPKELHYTLIGFESEDFARAASTRVAQVIDELVPQLGLSLAGLDGVTISVDYDAGLRQLDRGYDATEAPTRTNDEVASGIAMTPYVLRDGRVMSHMILSAAVVPLIDQPISGVSGKYIVAHELSHAHEHYFRDRQLPNTLLNVKITKSDEAVLFEAADACWGEYAACYFSAPVHPDQAKLFEMTVLSLLTDARQKIVEAKRQWLTDRNFTAAWQKISAIILALLKYFSYLLGHAAGLNKSIEELAPGAWGILQSNPWISTWIEKLDRTLQTMLETFEEWQSLDAFDPLKQVARGLLTDCGISISDSSGSLYVYVDAGKLPISFA
jgi:hypothetical protein